MLSRKINAIFSLLSTYLLLDHSISNAIKMLSGGRIARSTDFLSWALVGVMAVHIFLSIYLAAVAHEGVEKREIKQYPKLNAATIFQRMSGILMIPFTALHIAGTIGLMKPPAIVHAALPPIFFSMVLAHLAVSGSKALITLGIGSAKFIKAVDIAIKVLCAATVVVSLLGFYLDRILGVM